jgi:hypothetical protein
VALQLAPDEPAAGPWRAELLTTVAARLMRPGKGESAGHRPVVLAIDGRSSSGKTTLADGILVPARWDEHQHEGAIEVPADCALLIVEGVGAARRETAHLTGAAVWVQSDEREAERRSVARVGQPGDSPTLRHLRDWMAEEVPFLADQRPWERADLVACGTPEVPCDPVTELVVAPPPGAGRPH